MKTVSRLVLSPGCLLAAALLFSASGPAFALEGIEALKERERKVTTVVQRVMDATVAIEGASTPASGSGVIVSRDGLILTAAHVTQAAGEELVVTFADGREVKAKSLGANRSRDAGMARITTDGEYPFVEMGSTNDLAIGTWCVALGHPGGFDSRRTPPVRLGRVWSKKTVHMLGSDCTLVGGDSGGPLFDLDAKLIGIHSSIGGGLAENRHVPIEIYRKYWDQMLAGQTTGSIGFLSARMEPDRPMLGVQFENSDDAEVGARITGVMGDSPAEAAGLKPGDRVVAIDGKEVRSRNELIEMIQAYKVGDELSIRYERDGKADQATVALAAAETIDFDNALGTRDAREPRGRDGDEEEEEEEEEGASED